MSALLNNTTLSTSGIIVTDNQVTPPSHVAAGIPYFGGTVAVDTLGAISYYHQGLPFTAINRLAASTSPINRYGSGAAPFDAAGRLAFAYVAPITVYASGVPYDATGVLVAV